MNATPYLTKYERAKILGTRAFQISMGAPVIIDVQGETDSLNIAKMELKLKKIPIIIRRYLPNRKYKDYTISDLNGMKENIGIYVSENMET
ncbi:MAG: DNA-directed RNA polymerase subunit K [Promethearchaeota archaeon]|jgi:DNA-directed RNA polymerase I, II, and III subunit RPABC2